MNAPSSATAPAVLRYRQSAIALAASQKASIALSSHGATDVDGVNPGLSGLIHSWKAAPMTQNTPTSNRQQTDREPKFSADPRPTSRPTAEGMEAAAPHHAITELPPLGYPISEEAVMSWFQQAHRRTPESGEIGVILDAMARRDAEQPATESPADRVFHDR
jgi:hypothetical protein